METPCLIDRLVEFVADEKSNELLITEASVCLAAVVCSDNYNEEQIDEGETTRETTLAPSHTILTTFVFFDACYGCVGCCGFGWFWLALVGFG